MTEAPPKFAPGDAVMVCRRVPPGHVRTPWYCRGRRGLVERVCGRFHNPEQLAYGNQEADRQVLYRVAFASTAIWPGYRGGASDRVEVEIYEHWLERCDAPEHGGVRE